MHSCKDILLPNFARSEEENSDAPISLLKRNIVFLSFVKPHTKTLNMLHAYFYVLHTTCEDTSKSVSLDSTSKNITFLALSFINGTISLVYVFSCAFNVIKF